MDIFNIFYMINSIYFIFNIFDKQDDSQGLRVEHYVADDVEHDADIDAKKKHSPIEDSPIHVIIEFSNPLQEV